MFNSNDETAIDSGRRAIYEYEKGVFTHEQSWRILRNLFGQEGTTCSYRPVLGQNVRGANGKKANHGVDFYEIGDPKLSYSGIDENGNRLSVKEDGSIGGYSKEYVDNFVNAYVNGSMFTT